MGNFDMKRLVLFISNINYVVYSKGAEFGWGPRDRAGPLFKTWIIGQFVVSVRQVYLI